MDESTNMCVAVNGTNVSECAEGFLKKETDASCVEVVGESFSMMTLVAGA